MRDVQIAYIGGGSRGWARTFMYDLALQEKFCGCVRLYDMDAAAAECNKVIADRLNENGNVRSKFIYSVSKTLGEALRGADFVVISILPGTFDEMEFDVHTGEKFGVYQSVGDTAGPGGVLRAMRAGPMFEEFARGIEKYCPQAFVINFTNPMTFCTRTLSGTFPKIKLFGCCHEVFGTQQLLCEVVKEQTGECAQREDIDTDVKGVNHFTWFTRAEYKGKDLFPLYRKYIAAHKSDDLSAKIKENPFIGSDFVKFDLFERYGQIAAAGDRHLAEFCNGSWYLKDPEMVQKWGFGLTSVAYRKKDLRQRLELTDRLVSGKQPVEPVKSGERFAEMMAALLGCGEYRTNVNLPNAGQLEGALPGAVVESNAVFRAGEIVPVMGGKPLCGAVAQLVLNTSLRQENLYRAVASRDVAQAYNCFVAEPLVSGLTLSQSEQLFSEMVAGTKAYLRDWKL